MSSVGVSTLDFEELLPENAVGRTEQLARHAETRQLIGIGHWVGVWHPQAHYPTNAASAYALRPKVSVLTFMLHMFMYLKANPNPPTFGGPGCTSLELSNPAIPPFTDGAKEYGLHASCDASILVSSVSGGNVMLAGARIDTLCQILIMKLFYYLHPHHLRGTAQLMACAKNTTHTQTQ